MFIHDVAHRALCVVSWVHSSLSTVWAIGYDENVDESIQVTSNVTSSHADMLNIQCMYCTTYSGALSNKKSHKSGQSSWILHVQKCADTEPAFVRIL